MIAVAARCLEAPASTIPANDRNVIEMRTFQPRWSDDPSDRTLPDIGNFRFAGALDVVRFAELDPVTTWRTWPQIWNLDDDGTFCCESAGSSLDSVRTLAACPDKLLECRETDLGYACPDRWVMIEPRHEWHRWYRLGEGDAESFVTLRLALAEYGIALLDVVVFDPDCHWWSRHEMTSASTTWPYAALN